MIYRRVVFDCECEIRQESDSVCFSIVTLQAFNLNILNTLC